MSAKRERAGKFSLSRLLASTSSLSHQARRWTHTIEVKILMGLLTRLAERHLARADRQAHSIVDCVIYLRDHLAEVLYDQS